MTNQIVSLSAFIILIIVLYCAYVEYAFDEDYEALKTIKKNDLLNDKNINDFFVKDVVKLLERLDKNSKRLMRKNPEVFLFHSKLKEVMFNRNKKC